MNTGSQFVPAGSLPGNVTPADSDARWYAIRTRSRHEKVAVRELDAQGVQVFLPLMSSMRQWSDRRTPVEMPLFPGYVFVHLALQNRLRVLQVPGVACLVGFAGRPAAVPEEEFAKIRSFLQQGLRAQPHPYLQTGRRVRVHSGPLRGVEGIVLRRKNGCRLVISLDLIQRSMAVDIDEADVGCLS